MKIYNEKTSQFEEVKSVKYYSGETEINDIDQYQIPYIVGKTVFLDNEWVEGKYLPNNLSFSYGGFSGCFKFNSQLLNDNNNLIISINLLNEAKVDMYINDVYYNYTSSSTLTLKYEEYKNASIGFFEYDVAPGAPEVTLAFSIETIKNSFVPVKSIKEYQDANNSITLEEFNQ